MANDKDLIERLRINTAPMGLRDETDNLMAEAADRLEELTTAHGGVRVKPLEWVEGPPGHHTQYAESMFGVWAAWEISGHAYWRAPGMGAGKLSGATEDDAKAAAQADYEQRILSALELSPQGGGPTAKEASDEA